MGLLLDTALEIDSVTCHQWSMNLTIGHQSKDPSYLMIIDNNLIRKDH